MGVGPDFFSIRVGRGAFCCWDGVLPFAVGGLFAFCFLGGGVFLLPILMRHSWGPLTTLETKRLQEDLLTMQAILKQASGYLSPTSNSCVNRHEENMRRRESHQHGQASRTCGVSPASCQHANRCTGSHANALESAVLGLICERCRSPIARVGIVTSVLDSRQPEKLEVSGTALQSNQTAFVQLLAFWVLVTQK